MEEISYGVLLLAQQLDLENDTKDTDQPVQNLAEELAIEDLMEVEAQKMAEEQETEKQPTEATGSRRICRKKSKKTSQQQTTMKIEVVSEACNYSNEC